MDKTNNKKKDKSRIKSATSSAGRTKKKNTGLLKSDWDKNTFILKKYRN